MTREILLHELEVNPLCLLLIIVKQQTGLDVVGWRAWGARGREGGGAAVPGQDLGHCKPSSCPSFSIVDVDVDPYTSNP